MKAGHDVRAIGQEQASVLETVPWAEIAIFPFTAIDSVLKEAGGSFEGKTLVDATNALGCDVSRQRNSAGGIAYESWLDRTRQYGPGYGPQFT
jgi:predicted dinucleotide-binding enzyme